MVQKIQVKRGLKANLPVLDIGEVAFCTDTNEVFIGTLSGNVLVNNNSMDLDELTDVDLTTTTPTEGNVLSYTGGKWKPTVPPAISGDINTYTVELSRWGIAVGFPTKIAQTINGTAVTAYQTTDYTNAYNNMMGINNAINWAYSQGYNKIVFPKGDYAVCYANVSSDMSKNRVYITNINNMIVDFDTSRLKVIYDSDVRQPYDKTKDANGNWIANTAATYLFGGTIIQVINCNYVTVRNVVLIGDKIDRSWSNTDEAYHDISYGLFVGDNCQFCTVEEVDTGYFMADGLTAGGGAAINTGYTSANPSVGYQMGFAVGALDASGNVLGTDTTHCVSNYISVAGNTPYYLQGYGYSQGATYLNTKYYQIYCYDSSKTFITKLNDTYVLRSFITPKNCAYVKFVVYETAVDSNGWSMSLKPGYLGQFIYIRNNYIHHNHRGGMSIGVNDMFIENNRFYNNGLQTRDYETDVPTFPASTLYHINMEDSKAHNINIRGNTFIGGRLSLALRGWDCRIEGNLFQNNSVCLYKVPFVHFEGNYLQNAGFTTFTYNISDGTGIRDWHIVNNYIDGQFLVYGTAPIDTISNNMFLQPLTLPCNVNIFKNNTFRVDTDAGYGSWVSLMPNQIIEGCSFIKSQTAIQNTVNFNGVIASDCVFTNLKIGLTNSTIRNSIITDCGFGGNGNNLLENCIVNKTGLVLQNKYTLGVDNSSFFVFTNDGNTVTLKGCTIIDANTDHTFGTDNVTYSYVNNIYLINTTLTKNGTTNKLGFDYVRGVVSFENSSVINNGPTAVTYTPSNLFRHTFKDSTFTNVTFVMKAADIYYSASDIGLNSSSIPTIGSFKLGSKIWNNSPSAGGSLGWICTTAGLACNSAWTTSTDYTFNTSHAGTIPYVASQVYSGTNVYQNLTNGCSQTTAPTFPAALNGRVDDVVGTVVWNASTAYNVGDKVIVPVGVSNPTGTSPTLSAVSNASSTLTATRYYVKYTWVTATGETKGSDEAYLDVAAGNNLSISVPAFPNGVTKTNIYVGTVTGQCRLQGSINTTGTSYVISAPINITSVFTPLTSSNGCWYECTIAGTSGATAPSWNKNAGTVFTDNAVSWKVRGIVTWQNIGTKADFREFGLISG